MDAGPEARCRSPLPKRSSATILTGMVVWAPQRSSKIGESMEHMGSGTCPFGFGSDATPTSGSKHANMPAAMRRDQLPELVKSSIEPGEDGQRTGRCLCGAVSFRINTGADKVFASHDPALRRWTGGVSMTVMVRAKNTTFHGWGNVVQYPRSDREMMCFCRLCGSSLFVRHTQPAAMDGMLSLSAGCLDDHEALNLTAELHADKRPDFFAFEGDRRELNSDEIEAGFSR